MIVETYVNTLCGDNLSRRWTPATTSDVLIGGSVLGVEDWNHLRAAYQMSSVVNVEIEHDDDGKGIADLLQARVHDDGTPFPAEVVRRVVEFVRERLSAGKRLYVHCQMGGSRSPAFAYAILRSFYKLTPEQALESIRTGRDDREYGNNPYHVSYMRSVEAAL